MTKTRAAAPDRLVDVLTSVQRTLARDLAERFGEADATVDQWRALAALIDAPDGLSMGELGERVQLPAASLTRLVDTLADAALVYRRPAADDGRRVEVQVAALGRRKLTQLDAIAAAQLASLDSRVVRSVLHAVRDLGIAIEA